MLPQKKKKKETQSIYFYMEGVRYNYVNILFEILLIIKQISQISQSEAHITNEQAKMITCSLCHGRMKTILAATLDLTGQRSLRFTP